MIFITATFQVKAEFAEQWTEITGSFTEATRAEPRCPDTGCRLRGHFPVLTGLFGVLVVGVPHRV
jgi:hypothetical protein